MSSLEELIQVGWAEHAERTAEVADRLEAGVHLVTDDAGAAKLMSLVNHAVGDHLGDRPRARAICEDTVQRLTEPGADPLCYLAVARHLAGDREGATTAEARAGLDQAGRIRVEMLIAQGLVHAGDWAPAVTRYQAALETAEALPEGHAGERPTAVVSNNIATEILEIEGRTEAQAALMEQAADASRRYWLRVGDWMNDMRADYLVALVQTALERPAKGREHAERGLATIAANGKAPVDAAFLHVARARACRDLGDVAEQMAAIETAEALAADFEEAGLRDWFQGELAKAR
jgi:hypothetical protein